MGMDAVGMAIVALDQSQAVWPISRGSPASLASNMFNLHRMRDMSLTICDN